MVWGGFSLRGGRSDLIFLERDATAKKQGYTAQSYIKVLEQALPTMWEPGLTFMQDNARIHTAKAVAKWLSETGIPVLDWPPYSPDLNP